MTKEFDKTLAIHCGPALAGIKPGNMISCSKDKFPALPEMLNIYREAMAYKGIKFEIIHQCEKRYLLLVYRENLMINYLRKPEIQIILHKVGYPTDGNSIDEMITFLKHRFTSHTDFPHEIGAFLGYPAEDLLGYWKNKGKNYKHCGHWKVYNNVEERKKQFRQFDMCKTGICRRLSEGISIIEMFCAA